jgi:hypothetical protein
MAHLGKCIQEGSRWRGGPHRSQKLPPRSTSEQVATANHTARRRRPPRREGNIVWTAKSARPVLPAPVAPVGTLIPSSRGRARSQLRRPTASAHASAHLVKDRVQLRIPGPEGLHPSPPTLLFGSWIPIARVPSAMACILGSVHHRGAVADWHVWS